MQLIIAPVKLQLLQSGIIGPLYEDSQRMRLAVASAAAPRAGRRGGGEPTRGRDRVEEPGRPLGAEGSEDGTE